MATEVATAPLPLIDSDKSTGPSLSRSHTPIVITTTSKINPAKVSVSSTSSSSSVTATPRRSSVSAASMSSLRRSSSDENINHNKSKDSPSPKRNNDLPKIIVKKEPTSPEPPSRHRPPKLRLSDEADPSGPQVPRTAGGSLSTLRDVGMACLSPGFTTHDPTMREQLQRSISVRDQQRSIIEARLQRHVKPSNGKDSSNDPGSARTGGGAGQSGGGSKRRPPNSLTIVPPPHQQFAHERVVQSAPLNQSFTGRNHPSNIHHPPPQHTHNPHNVNRLPPISDVFASSEHSGRRSSRPIDPAPHTSRNYYPNQHRTSQSSPKSNSLPRPREHRSAEEALQILSGGREDLLPRIIHYGGHQPPTPPSPLQAPAQHTPSKLNVNGDYQQPHSAGGSKRRRRSEYERDSGDYNGSRDSPESKRQKKEEFLSLCARAWELFHS